MRRELLGKAAHCSLCLGRDQKAAGVLVEPMHDSRAGDAATEPAPTAPSLLARRLTVVKVAKPNQDMRFDVPVIGQSTVETMIRAGATCLSIEAGRTLLFDRDALLKRANDAGITIVAASR